MPTTNHGAINTPTDANTADISNILLTMGQSIEQGVVGYYADNTARDAGTLALRNAGKKGFKAFVLAPPSGDSPAADWCGWNGSEWIWENPSPVTYNSGVISGVTVNFTTLGAHTPSIHTFTPVRSGFAEVRLWVSAQTSAPGYGSGYVRPRYTSGTLFTGGTVFTVLEDYPNVRKDTTYLHYPVPIYLTKNVSTSIAFEVASFSGAGGWLLNAAQWFITQT